jgi:hypothetical protein
MSYLRPDRQAEITKRWRDEQAAQIRRELTPEQAAKQDRCAAHVLEGDVLLGCPEIPAYLLPASGLRAQDGLELRVALCPEHR